MARRAPIERFMEKVEVDNNGCWIWTASLNRFGYGRFWSGVREEKPHRFAYEHFIGPVPDGLQLDHLCRVRRCCNPEHLEPVTPAENTNRSPFAPARKTHCPQGHEYTPENTRIDILKSGRTQRTCRACGRLRYHARDKYRRAERRSAQPART